MIRKWWDIVSCRDLTWALSKKTPEKTKEMLEFLHEFMEFICSIKFQENQKSLHLVQKGILLSTKAALELCAEFLPELKLNEFFTCGRCLLGDCIENHHFVLRSFNMNPTAKQCKTYQKATTTTQILKKVSRHHNYEEDTSTDVLIEFSNLRKVQNEEELEGNAEFLEFSSMCIESGFDPRDFHDDHHDFSEKNSVTNYIAYCLRKTVDKSKYKILSLIHI